MVAIENRLDQKVKELMTKEVLSVDVSDKILDVQHFILMGKMGMLDQMHHYIAQYLCLRLHIHVYVHP